MSVEHCWDDTDKGKTEVLEEKLVPLPLCRPHIFHVLTSEYRSRVRETATYRCDDTRGCVMQF